jgi:hypothetical protein
MSTSPGSDTQLIWSSVTLCKADYLLYFQGPSYYPMSHPPLPTDEILEHPESEKKKKPTMQYNSSRVRTLL